MPDTPNETHRFQVDLRGLIDILSNHLYSTPNVFIRELLQNGCDSIQMRKMEVDPDHHGVISLEVVPVEDPADPGQRPTLIVSDSGIGLTEEEIHLFLSTVGRSSKRDDFFQTSSDFIGQFGIGLLSCFTVSEEITLVTKSAREPNATPCKWTARAEGTYDLETLDLDIDSGATVYLRARAGHDDLFSRETIEKLARTWGELLPFEINVSGGLAPDGKPASPVRITMDQHPIAESGQQFDYRAAMEFGERILPNESKLFDVVPLRSDVGDVTGVAYILGRQTPFQKSQEHRVYLKGMLLAESNESILPEWAFFARAVVNAKSLRPTASREGFYEDSVLETAREALGSALKKYLVDLSFANPEKLQKLIKLHWLSFKALAIQDDEFFETVIQWLPFSTTMGMQTLPEIARTSPQIRYLRRDEEFRQVEGVAGAQRICVVNGSYVYDEELLERAQRLTDFEVEKLDSREITYAFEDLDGATKDLVFDFVKRADRVLEAFNCRAEVRKFSPAGVPVFFVSNEAANFLKSVEQSKDGGSDSMMDSILDSLSREAIKQAHTSLCFNYNHPQIKRLTQVTDFDTIESSVRMLYVQSLLLGQQPLTNRELDLLTEGITTFLDWGLARGGMSE